MYIGEFSRDPAVVDRLLVVWFRVELLSDEAVFVGVHDLALQTPDLHPHDSLGQHTRLHQKVKVCKGFGRPRPTVDDRRIERGFDDPVARKPSPLLRRVQRLRRADP